jgi:hypothetical protein
MPTDRYGKMYAANPHKEERMALPVTLMEELLKAIHDENLMRYAANAAEPYNHDVYEVHESRIHRLVHALADDNGELEDVFNNDLHDCVHDGLEWQARVFAERKADIEAYWAEA